jgi:hypothetical protein
MLGLILSASALASAGLLAQGTTTATIMGSVSTPDGQADGTRVRIVNRSNGYAVESEVRRGRYFVSGLESGGPYTIELRRIGLQPQRRDSVMLRVGEQLEIDFTLEGVAVALDTVQVETSVDRRSVSRSRIAGGGTAATIGEGVLRDMPALNRDLLDFSRLVPELGTRFGGISGAGVSLRFNSYLIDGGSERMLNGNGSLSGFSGGKPISIEAVKEYQVLLAPWDPRYGDFAGALINAVTRNGTNQLGGTAFVYSRNETMARNTPFLRETPYDRSQVGFSVGGPIVRDRAHFFVASEFQRFNQPSTGPYVGGGATEAPTVSASDIQRFENILRGYGLEPGNGGRVTRTNPNSNIFARLDLALPRLRSRAVLRQNYVDVWQTFFTRPLETSFQLTGSAWTNRVQRHSTALQLFTQSRGGWTNELLLNRTRSPSRATQFARAPRIEVIVPEALPFKRTTLVAGAPDVGQGSGSHMKTFEAADHLQYHAGKHTLSAGARVDLFSFNNISTRGQFGRWTFNNLNALEAGQASSFRVEKDFGSATAATRGRQLAFYLGDEWRATNRLTLSGGLRSEVLTFTNKPAYNATIESLYGRRTDEFPGTSVYWLPRLGFVLDLDRAGGGRLRGGAGTFAGRPPLAWVAQALRFDGVGTLSLSCQAGEAPPFTPSSTPVSCNNGDSFANGLVNLIDPGLRMAEVFRSSLAYERELPGNVAMSLEGLYTRTLSDFVFVNPNLSGPQGTGARGRVMYGSVEPNGRVRTALVSRLFHELIDLRNHGNGHSIAVTGRVQKRFGDHVDATASYTRSRVRDVQSVLTFSPVLTYVFWATGRSVSGRHDQLTTGVSAYEIPHRVLLSAGWTSPARRWRTTVSIYYVGESGVPFTYTDSSAAGLGDLNADSTNLNDPMYVPRNATDPAEITFAGTPAEVALQRQAFESFIASQRCLRRQRGRIMARNSCIGPWVHTATAALRQELPVRFTRGHAVSLDVEIFNFLNLLSPRWGLARVPPTNVLQHVGQDTVTPSEPVFRFDPARAAHSTANAESAYQIQLALRYRF